MVQISDLKNSEEDQALTDRQIVLGILKFIYEHSPDKRYGSSLIFVNAGHHLLSKCRKEDIRHSLYVGSDICPIKPNEEQIQVLMELLKEFENKGELKQIISQVSKNENEAFLLMQNLLDERYQFKRGLALIMSWTIYDREQNQETTHDREALKNTLSGLGFDIQIENNNTVEETMDVLEKSELKMCDKVFIFIESKNDLNKLYLTFL